MFKKVLYKIFGTRNDRLLKNFNFLVSKINQLEENIAKFSDSELKAKTAEFKQRYANGETLNKLLPEVFAVCREASKRVLGMRHFDVQLIGAMVLNQGKIAEMRTGEGKTLAATLSAYLNALTGNGVHVVTVNDYLAKRDATEMGKLYNFLGLSVGINLPNMTQIEKRQAYACDITYGTNNEFGFDYLRDNMVFDINEKVQRELSFAIVDEVDSILIDEARTPLIISGPAEGSVDLYIQLNKVPPLLTKQEAEDSTEGDFWIDEKNHNVIISESGHIKAEQILADIGLINHGDNLYNVQHIALLHHLAAALKAHYVYYKDQHYVVQDNEVIIVDEFTGRLMSGRRWSDGLHQAVEAKENVEINQENQTMASITFQNYFRMYQKLSGMTGTADTEAYEFEQIYGLETVVIPTNNPMIRKDYNDKIYMNKQYKYAAIIEDVRKCNENGQPVLIGTTSVENSEELSHLLTQANLKHEVLNAKQHAREADIIAQAGRIGAITVATNMAGRGTDIVLGGNAKNEIIKLDNDANLTSTAKQEKIDLILAEWKQHHEVVIKAGGLAIIGTERHESRRIDNQLRGRSGRQGDPGCSRFYLSLDDALLRIFGGERMRGLMQRLGMAEGEAIEHKLLSRSIESAQRKVEGHNFDIRKQLLDYDDVSNDQRRVIYKQRNDLLSGNDFSNSINAMITAVIGQTFENYIPPKSFEEMWDVNGLELVLNNEFKLDYSIKQKLIDNTTITEEQLKAEVIAQAMNKYIAKIDNFKQQIKLDLDAFVNNVIGEDKTTWNVNQLDNFCLQNRITLTQSFVQYFNDNPDIDRTSMINYFFANCGDIYTQQIVKLERSSLLRFIDHHWRNHITELEHLRQGIHLRGYAQKDPKQEYKQESFALFANMLDNIKYDVVKMLLTFEIQGSAEINQPRPPMQTSHPSINNVEAEINTNQSISRNSPCPCGSGKKYKHCCGKLSS
jgi:preprotein translocase subunit SecA